ncbi:hypothetical protein AC481_05445 [miscellaneous Crenarchaeota group archaeon SMTZ-80]|nr:MAG: hypothetical protein AC481_05445 [miscellaneous Crenarchaeota group archaeon SMTZ-80]
MEKNGKKVRTEEELLKDAIEALEKGENELVKKLVLQVKAIRKNKTLQKKKIEPKTEESKIEEPKIKEIKEFLSYRFVACTYCGREMPLEALYCDKCGFRLR